jgi:Zn-finger nucleic acid-binding protein
MDANALHCPNCGGPAAPGDAACGYCRAVLATVSCPSCFALMFEGAVYCPKCGARRARAARTDGHAPCPCCRAAMQDVQVGDTAMLECNRCRAVWIDAATFEHVCASSEAQAAVLHHWPTPAKPPTEMEIVRYRKCVACGTRMNRLNFGKMSGTIVDVCKGHGTLLDAGELHRIVTFVRGGGLERMRQRQIDDLKEQEERTRMFKTTKPSDGGGTASWDATGIGVELLSLLVELKD